MKPTTLTAELPTLSWQDEPAMETIDRMLKFLSTIDRNMKVGDVLDEWLDVRVDLGRLLSNGPARLPHEAGSAGN
jgi:hypothetical protein